MATSLYLRDTPAPIVLVNVSTKEARTARGGAAKNVATNTAAGPTSGIIVTNGAAGNPVHWYSRPLGAVTVSGTITFNLRGLESGSAANVGFQVKVERCAGDGTVISTIVDSEHGTELSTAEAQRQWTASPTSTALAAGDRLKITVYGNDAGGTMAGGQTFSLFYNGPTGGASGDSSVTFFETLTELSPIGLAQDLVAYWSMDEGSGVRDDLIGTNHLTDVNTVGSAVGKRNTAGSFVAASQEQLTRADDPALSMGDIPFTVAAWVYITSLPGAGGGRQILQKYRTPLDSNDDWEYSLNYAGSQARFSFGIGNGSGGSASIDAGSFGAASTATWYLVVGWHDPVANTINIQVNNGTVDSASFSGGSYDSDGVFRIGGHANTGWFMDGRLDGVGIWKRVLTSEERTALYNSGTGWDEALTYPALAGTRIAMVV